MSNSCCSSVSAVGPEYFAPTATNPCRPSTFRQAGRRRRRGQTCPQHRGVVQDLHVEPRLRPYRPRNTDRYGSYASATLRP